MNLPSFSRIRTRSLLPIATIRGGCRTTGSSIRCCRGEAGDLGRHQPQPGQGLQLRLRLLPGRRRSSAGVREVDRARLARGAGGDARPGAVGRAVPGPRFAGVPQSLRRLNDIAFSGDGEPTTYPRIRRGGPRGRGDQAAAQAGRGEADPDHQRHAVPPARRAGGAGDPRRQPGGDLGQARRRHRGLLPARSSGRRSRSSGS